jgi:GT2 family glycosyltransferase
LSIAINSQPEKSDPDAQGATRGRFDVVVPLRPRPLAAVIVTYNSQDVLTGLLDSLQASLAGVEKREVIVVDNNSQDSSVEIASSHPIGVHVIQTGRNAGYAAAINIACATLDANVDVLILNPDIRLHPDTLQSMRSRLSHPGIGIVVPKIVDEADHLSFSLRRDPSILTAWSEALLGGSLCRRLGIGEVLGDAKLYEGGGQVDWATGAILLISARARQAVGLWDERFFLYSEEVDFMRRIRKAGMSVDYFPDAVAYHKGGDTRANPFLFGLSTMNRVSDYKINNGALKTKVFYMGVFFGELIRCWRGAEHRAALDALLHPEKWRKRIEATIAR